MFQMGKSGERVRKEGGRSREGKGREGEAACSGVPGAGGRAKPASNSNFQMRKRRLMN